jgi:beta-galactosidase/beta-glucuronidase
MVRERWLSLDGDWEFAFDPKNSGIKEAWYNRRLPDTVRVPFCLESEASGLEGRQIFPLFWYAREFRRQQLPRGTRFFINFGAVDYEAEVWINGNHVGGHRGGYTPFSLEVTDFLQASNRISVRVADYPTTGTLRGKQYIWEKLSAVFYTPASGIWQPVFVFATGDSYINHVRLTSDMDTVAVAVDVEAQGKGSCEVRVIDSDGRVAAREKLPVAGSALEKTFEIVDPRCWSAEDPHLYRVEITLFDENETVSDRVVSQTGLRRVEARDGRILLNGEPIYLKMLLVQGYYPGGHYSPVEEDAFEREIITYKSLGFNGIRIHEKIEDPRYLALCDKHGLLVWEEMPSPFLFGGLDEEQYAGELEEVMARDACHPSLMAFVLFNESWGIYPILWSARKREFLQAMYRKAKGLNPNILVIDNSGYDHVITDVVDVHHYLDTDKKIHRLYRILGDRSKMSRQFMRLPKTLINIVLTHIVARVPYLRQGVYRGHEPFVISEFGGAGYYKGSAGFMENFRHNVEIMNQYPRISGYCLTQAYDVENEKNGLLNFDRSEKYPRSLVREINALPEKRPND